MATGIFAGLSGSVRLALAASAVLVGLSGAAPARAADGAVEAQIVDKLSAYLRTLSTMTGDFIQIAPNGRISEGTFAIRRPGRMRFEYSPPDPTLMVVDGFWAAVLDEENDRSIDRFPLSETPLNVFLKKNVDLAAEGVIAAVSFNDREYRITAIDPEGLSQGDITMIFDREPILLRQWIVTDALGQTTTIVLRNAKIGGKVDNELFVIPEPKRRGDDDW
ncbi:MAG: outer membrane lipoprotein carrier protein LolA [Pseudomonadota bacterium]